MFLIYVFNPVALCIALFHFLLSSCRSSSLPEIGLLLVTMMVALGIVLRLKAAPKRMREVFHPLHTASATFSVLIALLVVGHLAVD